MKRRCVTFVQLNYLPTIYAQLALSRNDCAKAIEELQTPRPTELAELPGLNPRTALYPVYVRGEAYLAAHRGSEAEAEFRKILDHSGIVVNEPIGALARLSLARAYSMQGETAKARAAYQDFLTLWKDADLDIPVLKEAQAESTRLK